MWNKRVAPAQAIQFIDSNSSVSDQEVLQYVVIKYGGIISLYAFLTINSKSKEWIVSNVCKSKCM